METRMNNKLNMEIREWIELNFGFDLTHEEGFQFLRNKRDGQCYYGLVENDRPHGRGTLFDFKTRTAWEGNFLNGGKEGKGTIWKKGKKSVGDYHYLGGFDPL